MRWFAVCCTVDVHAETLNALLTSAYDQQPKTFMLVVVKNKAEKYTEVTNPPVDEGVFNSPFKDLSELECYHVLYQMYQDTGSDLNYRFFVIVDEQSVKHQTVKLCGWYEGVVQTMRVEFNMANIKMGALSVGHCGFPDTDY